ncbi:hypothetical protein LCGC14_2895520, partial [marine sediment metagenome]
IAQAKRKAEHAQIASELDQTHGPNNFYENLGKMKDQTKKPGSIDGAALSNIFRSLQKSGTTTETSIIPSISGARNINPNPISNQESQVKQKFNEIANFEDIEKFDSDKSFKERWLSQPDGPGGGISLMYEFNVKKDITIRSLLKNLEVENDIAMVEVNGKEYYSEDFNRVLTPQDSIYLAPFSSGGAPEGKNVRNTEDIIDNIKIFGPYEEGWIRYLYTMLFDPKSNPEMPAEVHKILFNLDLVVEAKKILESTQYDDKEIITDENINWEVLTLLREKFYNNEEFTQLERLIADVAIFHMGGRDLVTLESLTDSDGFTDSDGLTSRRIRLNLRHLSSAAKVERLKQIVYEQLHHYFRTGERKYTRSEASLEAGWSESFYHFKDKILP